MKKFMLSLMVMMIAHLLMTLPIMAQTDHVFKLTKENGHFFLNTSVNGIDARLMLESGVPGLMMSDVFYEAHKDSLRMEVKPCDEKIRYLGGIHNIKYTGQARLRIGDAIFEGTVKIADGNHKLMIPINMFRHASDNSGIVRIDLTNSELRICNRQHLARQIKDATALDLTFNQWSMPVVGSRLDMDVDGRRISLEGNFIVDMGNGSLLFLNKSQTKVVKMLNDGQVKLKEAHNNSGKVVAEGLYADRLRICGRRYKGVSVGVASFKRLDECGHLGLKFFTMPTIFDFDKGKMYLCKDEL